MKPRLIILPFLLAGLGGCADFWPEIAHQGTESLAKEACDETHAFDPEARFECHQQVEDTQWQNRNTQHQNEKPKYASPE